MALVANLDSNSVTPVDLGTWRAGTPIPVGAEPVAIAVAVTASGAATAFVADAGANTVTPIDVATLQPGAAIPVGLAPETIAAAPGEVLVGNFGNRTLTAINPGTRQAGGTVALPLNPTGITVNAGRHDGLRVRGRGRRRSRRGRPDAGPAGGTARCGAGDRVERGRDDGVGDAAGGHPHFRFTGHREGGPSAPPRRSPVRHRHRRRLIRAVGRAQAL